MRVLYEQNSKKRKISDEPKAKKTGETVLDHYFNFIHDTLDVLDRHEQFREHYLIIDNAPYTSQIGLKSKLSVEDMAVCIFHHILQSLILSNNYDLWLRVR